MWITLYDTKEHKHTKPFEVERLRAGAGEFYLVCKKKNFDMLADFCSGRVSFIVWEKAEVVNCEFRNSDGWAFTVVPYDETARNI